MTARKKSALAERRREAKESREAQQREAQIKTLNISEDIDPTDLLKSAKLIIHSEVIRMAKAQAEGEPITPNDARKLMQMIGTIGSMLAIAEKTKPDLSGMTDEELGKLAEGV
jgi:hypothetical protein